MKRQFSNPRSVCTKSSMFAFLLVLACAAILGSTGLVAAQTIQTDIPVNHGTGAVVLIFADQALRDEQWNALSAALRRGQLENQTKLGVFAANSRIVRGNTIAPGFEVNDSVSIYLHGKCDLAPGPTQYSPIGTLGWVKRNHDRIEPFIHLDCPRIALVLRSRAARMDRQQRIAAMGSAIAQVILHELIHVTTQSPQHSAHGITKAQFGEDDLLGEDTLLTSRLLPKP